MRNSFMDKYVNLCYACFPADVNKSTTTFPPKQNRASQSSNALRIGGKQQFFKSSFDMTCQSSGYFFLFPPVENGRDKNTSQKLLAAAGKSDFICSLMHENEYIPL